MDIAPTRERCGRRLPAMGSPIPAPEQAQSYPAERVKSIVPTMPTSTTVFQQPSQIRHKAQKNTSTNAQAMWVSPLGLFLTIGWPRRNVCGAAGTRSVSRDCESWPPFDFNNSPKNTGNKGFIPRPSFSTRFLCLRHPDLWSGPPEPVLFPLASLLLFAGRVFAGLVLFVVPVGRHFS